MQGTLQDMITNEICTGGVVRRLEDLNRITIPKDICMKAKIKSGDALKIYCTEDGDIILRPYDKYELIRENIKKADEALQALNNRINIIVFDKNNVIYSSTQRKSAPINNYKIMQAMKGNYIDEVALNDAILELYPNANLSVNQQEGLAIAIVTSMGHDADTVVFDYLWKIICN